MAVIQISRIQHRRGKKLSGSGLPQLSSGEIGWAIDTQELYIGNGSVSEGAPSVGNTKILTEADDLLELAGQYAYKRDSIQTGASIGSPIERALQDKLDDVVSARDFGAIGDGTDQTVALQRAIDQLFINSATKGLYSSRVVLRIPAGEYLLSSPLYIPPFANIEGDGKGKTLINAAGGHAFYTKNEDSVPGAYADDSTTTSLNMPRQIKLRGMSIRHTSYGGALRLESCKDSIFEDLEILGNWNNGDGIVANYVGVLMNSLSTAISSNNNRFVNCNFNGFSHAVYSDYDVKYNKFDDGRIENCGNGFSFGVTAILGAVGQATGPSYNNIIGYDFVDVDQFGINIIEGIQNRSQNNTFLNVGNEAGGSATPVYPVINFAKRGNISDNDYFERTADLTVNQLYHTNDYVPEIAGYKNYRNNFPVATSLGQQAGYLMQLPADQPSGKIELDYSYDCPISSGPVYITGKMTITYNKDNSEFLFTDEYVHTGNTTKEGQLTWTVNLVDSAGQYEDKITFDFVNNILDENNVVDTFTFNVSHSS